MLCFLFNFICATNVLAKTIEPVRVEATITGYTSSVNETDSTPHITASGRKTEWGTVACPRKYPFGTMVQIAGEEFYCWDRMAKKYDDRFDIWFPSVKEAKEWGKIQQVIYIYDRKFSFIG